MQPNTTLVSIPITTASLPSLITSRASNGLRTIRYQPSPGPPACASTYRSNCLIRRAWSRIESMSSQLLRLSG